MLVTNKVDINMMIIVVVQLLTPIWLFATPWTAASYISLSITISQSLLRTHVHWVDDAIQASHPLLSPSSPALTLSQHQGIFQSALCIRWPKYWSFSFSISPSNEYSELISFRIDWFDLAVQGTLKSLLQCHSLKASIFSTQHSLWSSSHVHTIQFSLVPWSCLTLCDPMDCMQHARPPWS